MEDIRVESLVIEPETCLVNDSVIISVTATNYGDIAGTTIIKCQYAKEETMSVTFSGVVSAQVQAGEAITITVTKPGGGVETLAATTDANKAYSVVYNALPGIGYKAKASIGEDALYLAATSLEVTFDVAKNPRTITLSVT